jgi:hypothetical protein
MAKVDYEKLRNEVKTMDKEVLKKVVTSVDGHTIYDPKKFTEAGLSKNLVSAFTRVHESGSHPKEQITSQGKVVDSLGGVYGLQLLEFIAGCFDVSSWKMGRGSRADHLSEQLVEKWSK